MRLKINKQESGQVMVFTLILLIVLALGSLFLFDIHSSVRGKIKAQSASEAAALSMANWQKESLNIIGELNIMKACNVLTTDIAEPLVSQSGNAEIWYDTITDYQWLTNASALISEAQLRVSFIGPVIGLGAAQVAAINNGITPDEDINKDMDTLIANLEPGAQAYENVPEKLEVYPEKNTQYSFGYTWREPYKEMLQAVRDTGCAVRPNGITTGLQNIQAGYLAIESFYEAILSEYWCQPSLKYMLMNQSGLGANWWKPTYSELSFPEESNISPLFITFLEKSGNFDSFSNNPAYGAGDAGGNLYDYLQTEVAKKAGWTEEFVGKDSNMLPPLVWCMYDYQWGNVPVTEDYTITEWSQWQGDFWDLRLAAPMRSEFQYNGAVAKMQCERNVKLRSAYKAKAKDKMLKENFLEETNKKTSTYEQERTVVGRAVAKPVGFIKFDDLDDSFPPNTSKVILPVFRAATVVPTTMFEPHMFDYQETPLELFLRWLHDQDSLNGDTSGLPAGGSRYLEALRRFDDVNWRYRGFNPTFSNSAVSHESLVTGDYLYDSASNPNGAGWLQQACARSSDSYSYYSTNGKKITTVYIYEQEDGKNYRRTYKANGTTLTLTSSSEFKGVLPTRHAFNYTVNDDDTLTLTGINYTNDQGLCVQRYRIGGGNASGGPPGPSVL